MACRVRRRADDAALCRRSPEGSRQSVDYLGTCVLVAPVQAPEPRCALAPNWNALRSLCVACERCWSMAACMNGSRGGQQKRWATDRAAGHALGATLDAWEEGSNTWARW